MFKAIVPSPNWRKHRWRSAQQVQVARRDAFHRGLRYESLEERCLLSGGQSGTMADKVVTVVATDAVAGDATGGTGTFEISRTGSTTNPLAVELYASGNAAPGTDYVLSAASGGTIAAVNTAGEEGNYQATIAASSDHMDVHADGAGRHSGSGEGHANRYDGDGLRRSARPATRPSLCRFRTPTPRRRRSR